MVFEFVLGLLTGVPLSAAYYFLVRDVKRHRGHKRMRDLEKLPKPTPIPTGTRMEDWKGRVSVFDGERWVAPEDYKGPDWRYPDA